MKTSQYSSLNMHISIELPESGAAENLSSTGRLGGGDGGGAADE